MNKKMYIKPELKSESIEIGVFGCYGGSGGGGHGGHGNWSPWFIFCR